MRGELYLLLPLVVGMKELRESLEAFSHLIGICHRQIDA